MNNSARVTHATVLQGQVSASAITIMSALPVYNYVAVNFFISVNFYFSFVLSLLGYITIPKSNGKITINRNKKLATTYILFLCTCLTITPLLCVFFLGWSICPDKHSFSLPACGGRRRQLACSASTVHSYATSITTCKS